MKVRNFFLPWVLLVLAMMACNLSFASPLQPSLTATPQPTDGPFVAARGLVSDNWSGYIVGLRDLKNNVVDNAQGEWIVPSVQCGTKTTAASIWVGIDGANDGTVEQAGTEQDCIQGQASYYAWFEIYPRPAHDALQLVIRPGDWINAQISYTGQGVFALKLTNQTTGQSFSTSSTVLRAKRRSVEWIVEAPFDRQVLPLADFGEVKFSNAVATLNGYTGPINDPHWRYMGQIMAAAKGTIKAQPSTLGADGSSFSVIWKSS